MSFWKKLFGGGNAAPTADLSLPYSRLTDLSGALLTHVLRPRGLRLDREVDFFAAECAKCRRPVPPESIAKAGTVLAMQSLFSGANVIGGLPSGTPRCRHCGHDVCSFTLQQVTSDERDAVCKALGVQTPQRSAAKSPTPVSSDSLTLPARFDGKTSYRDMFRKEAPEELRAMCRALPVEQLDLGNPGRPPHAREMSRAITQTFAVATYMATAEVPTEYGDILFPRLVAKISEYRGSDLHLELCDLVRDFAIHLEAGGRHRQALQVMLVLRDSLFWRAWSDGNVCFFAALNNLALETKQPSDFQAALDFARQLSAGQAQQVADAINNLKQKMEKLCTMPSEKKPQASVEIPKASATTMDLDIPSEGPLADVIQRLSHDRSFAERTALREGENLPAGWPSLSPKERKQAAEHAKRFLTSSTQSS